MVMTNFGKFVKFITISPIKVPPIIFLFKNVYIAIRNAQQNTLGVKSARSIRSSITVRPKTLISAGPRITLSKIFLTY